MRETAVVEWRPGWLSRKAATTFCNAKEVDPDPGTKDGVIESRLMKSCQRKAA